MSSTAPSVMKKRRPTRSSQRPITGWQTMPAALYTPWTRPISASVAAQPLDVQRQEDEAAEARHEEEVRERRPREGPAGDELEPADHERCGPLSPRRRMAATMTCVAMIRVKCSTRGE